MINSLNQQSHGTKPLRTADLEVKDMHQHLQQVTSSSLLLTDLNQSNGGKSPFVKEFSDEYLTKPDKTHKISDDGLYSGSG
jgi:hypothetical protein